MTRGVILHLTRDEVLARGWSQIAAVPMPPVHSPEDAGNRPIAYRLDPGFNGGFDPTAAHCASWSFGDRTPTADCVGFVLWASGIDRMQPGFVGTRGEWLNCASLIDDATSGAKRFSDPVPEAQAMAGDWLVTRDHIGLIVRPETRETGILVIDCSPRHGRQAAVNTGLPWSDSCRVLRPNFYA